MMGTSDPQPSMFYHINLEQFVTADHPMRKIRPLIDTERIRTLCEPLYADTGRPSIPPEQLFLALLGGYLLGVTSERALVRELTGNLVLCWFVGLDLDQTPWDHSTFSQNRKRRFTERGLFEQLFDETVALAITQKLVSPPMMLEEPRGQANASHKRFVPIEVFLKPEEYKQRIRSLDAGLEPAQDPGNPTITFRGGVALQPAPCPHNRSRCEAGEQEEWDGGDSGLHGERPDGESALALAGDHGRAVPRACLGDGWRTAVAGSLSSDAPPADSARRRR